MLGFNGFVIDCLVSHGIKAPSVADRRSVRELADALETAEERKVKAGAGAALAGVVSARDYVEQAEPFPLPHSYDHRPFGFRGRAVNMPPID